MSYSFLFENLGDYYPGSIFTLSKEESQHALKVLRLKNGETIRLVDGKGNMGIGEILLKETKEGVEMSSSKSAASKNKNNVNVLLKKLKPSDDPIHQPRIALYLSVIKNDKMDWAIQKACETGALSITPMITDRSVVKVEKKSKSDKKKERWQRIADESLKQSGRAHRCEIEEITTFEKALESSLDDGFCLFFHCSENEDFACEKLGDLMKTWIKRGYLPSKVSILIGPEGGFSSSELKAFQKRIALNPEKKASICRLSPRIYRAETAAVSVCSFFDIIREVSDREFFL
jgi:16S rRNA (uracil1498-N3)-methyltransferase